MIASSFIYYYSTSEEIEDDGLALRRVRLDVDSPNEEDNHGVSRRVFSTFVRSLIRLCFPRLLARRINSQPTSKTTTGTPSTKT